MIVYLETSALVKLVVTEPHSDAVDALVAANDYVTTSVIAYAECRAAIARAGTARRVDAKAAVRSLDQVWGSLHTLDVDALIARHAGELAARHLLRGMDALHLASGLELADGELEIAFATFDRDLARAARAERLVTPLVLR